MSIAVTQRSSHRDQSGGWSSPLCRRREAETGQCDATAEDSRGECQNGVVMRLGTGVRMARQG